jgi:hypothetical protein
MVEGLNQNRRASIPTEFEGGDVYLLDTELADTDGDAELQSNAVVSQTTAASDWSLTNDSTAGTTTLENTSSIIFPEITSSVTIVQVVVQSTANADFLLLDSAPTGDTQLSSGDEVEIPAGSLTYVLGGE